MVGLSNKHKNSSYKIEQAANSQLSTAIPAQIILATAREALLTEREVAEWLGLALPTLRNWRSQGRGPEWLALSRRAVRYRRADIEAFREARRCQSTSQAEILEAGPGKNARS